MNYESLSAEQRERVNACRTPEDVFKLAKDEGYELSDHDLEAVSGGDWDCWDVCTKFQKPTTCNVRDCSPFGVI